MNLAEQLGTANCPVEYCVDVLKRGTSTDMMREAVSSIGRRRDPKYQGVLIEYSQHPNPEVALQAIRGLLVFKKDPKIQELLRSFLSHPNEMVRDVLYVELKEPDKKNGQQGHVEFPPELMDLVVQGNALDLLKKVPDESIHLTFTSPPYYNARDYTTYQSYRHYLDVLSDIFQQLHRVTKEGRFFVLNTSPVIIPRAGRKYSSRRYAVPFDLHARIEEIGWQFIDDIVWMKPAESAKNRVAGFEMHRQPLTYKPNPCTEYLMVYRKKSSKLIDWNLKQYGEKTIKESLIDDYERSNVWNIHPAQDKVHSAVFPIDLCSRVISHYSMKGDLVYDPFAGSGTMGAAAIKNDRKFFLTELSETYIDRIKEKLGEASLLQHPIRFLNEREFSHIFENKTRE